MKEVFCKDCIYKYKILYPNDDRYSVKYEIVCKHPTNYIKRKEVINNVSFHWTDYLKSPKELNKNNDCYNFQLNEE